MRGSEGQSPIQYATIILVIVALVGSWMAYANAGTAKGATKKEVESATKGLATKSDLKDLARESTLKSISDDILSAIRGKKITKTDVIGFLSGKSWSDTKTLLDRAGVSVPKKKVTVNYLKKASKTEAQDIIKSAGVKVGGVRKAEYGKGIKIWLITNTRPGVFWSKVERGARDAAKLLGVNMKFIYTEGKTSQAVSKVKQAPAEGIDGVGVNLTDPNAYDAAVKQTIEAGVPVISYNTDDPKGSEGNARLAYVGQDLEKAGEKIARELVERADLGSGDFVLLGAGLPEQSYARIRSSGTKKVLEEHGIEYEMIKTSPSVAKGEKRYTSYLEAHPKVDAILGHGAFSTASIPGGIEGAGMKGKVVGAGFDIDIKSAKGIKNGYLKAVIDQQPYLQGWYSVIELALHKKYKMDLFRVDTGMEIVHPGNIDEVLPLVKKGVR